MLSSYILKNCFCPNKLQDFDFRDLCSIFSRPTDGDKLMNLQNMPLVSSHLKTASNKDGTKNKHASVDGIISSSLPLPSSCQDLEKLHHSLDGLYLVKNQETKKIQTVFCQFKGSKSMLVFYIFVYTKI